MKTPKRKRQGALHYEREWNEKNLNDTITWDEMPRYVIMNSKHIMEKSQHRNDHTWRGIATASTVRKAELVTRLLRLHASGGTKPICFNCQSPVEVYESTCMACGESL